MATNDKQVIFSLVNVGKVYPPKKQVLREIYLGFYYGADLKAPAGLMEGSGKGLRHVKITSLSQLDKPEILKLLKAASVHLPKLPKH